MKKTFALLSMIVFILSCSMNNEKAEAFYEKGNDFMKQNKPDSAAAYYKKAVDLNPKLIKAHEDYQKVSRYNLEMTAEIQEEYEAISKENPNDAVFQYLYGLLIEDNQEQLDFAEKVISIDPDFYGGYMLKAHAYKGISHDLEALVAYKKVIEKDPENIEAIGHCASTLSSKGEFKEANEYYKKAYKIDPKIFYYQTAVWRNIIQASDTDSITVQKYIAKADSVLEKNPDNTEILFQLYYFYRGNGKLEIAKELENRILKIDSTGIFAENSEIDKVFMERDPVKQVKLSQVFLNKFPKSRYNRYVFRIRFRHFLSQEKIAEDSLLAVFKVWTKFNPKSFNAYEKICSYYSNTKMDYEKTIRYAREGFKNVNKYWKGFLAEYEAWAYYQQEKYKEAFEKMVLADSLIKWTNYVVQYRMGAVHYKTGDYDNALKYLGKSLALKENEEASEMFKLVYKEKFGTNEGAEKFLREEILSFAAVDSPYAAPDFTLADLKDKEIKLSDFKGSVVLVHFWKPG